MSGKQKGVLVELPKPAGVPSVVRLLREVLDRAEQGEVIGVAIATSCSQLCDGSCYEIGEGSIAALNLAIDRLKVRLLKEGE